MRICLMGNSHVAAIRNAWTLICEQGAAPEGIEITFYAATRDRMARLIVESHRLVPPPGMNALARNLAMTSGGSTAIDPTQHDVFVLHGLLFRVPQLDCRWSSAVRRSACRDAFEASASCTLLRVLRRLTDKPTILSPVPLRSRRRRHDLTAGFVSYDATCRLMASVIESAGTQFMGQPFETVAPHSWFTRDEFAKGARSLDSNRPIEEADDVHMNDAFGLELLKALFARLDIQFT